MANRHGSVISLRPEVPPSATAEAQCQEKEAMGRPLTPSFCGKLYFHALTRPADTRRNAGPNLFCPMMMMMMMMMIMMMMMMMMMMMRMMRMMVRWFECL